MLHALRRSLTIRTSTSSSPAAACRRTANCWIACKPGFFLPVRVLSRFFRRRFLEGLLALHEGGRLTFFGDLAGLANPGVFRARLAPLRRAEWVIYAKSPFGGPQNRPRLSVALHPPRVAISTSRIVAFDGHRVSFRWKDYRARASAPGAWIKTMTLPVDVHAPLRCTFSPMAHRIRHYGFLPARASRTSRASDR